MAAPRNEGRRGQCQRCGFEVLFARTIAGTVLELDVADTPLAIVDRVAFNPRTGGCMVIGHDTLSLARVWRDRHGVTFHAAHFATCSGQPGVPPRPPGASQDQLFA